MKVQVIIPPYMVRDGRAEIPKKAMLPVGPLIMATLLQKTGCKVKVTDLTFHKVWLPFLPDALPDIVLLSCHTPRNVTSCIIVLEDLRKQWRGVKQPHVVLGGNCCAELGIEDFAKLGLHVDAVVQEYGHTPEVLDLILSRASGNIKATGPLGHLPMPELNLLPLRVRQQYLNHSQSRYPMYGHGLGCRYYKLCGAKYCGATLGQPWTPRNFQEILQEVAQAKAYGYQEIWCVDNLLFMDEEQTLRFDAAVAKHRMKWSGMTRPEIIAHLSLGYLRKFQTLEELAMGVEANELSSLKILNRGAPPDYQEQCTRAFELANRANIGTNAFVMLDFPHYTEREFWKLFRFLTNLKTEMVSWSFFNPPARDAVLGKHALNQYGFYHEPFGLSSVKKNRAIQHAMALTGVWWREWYLDESDPFFETESIIGVNFLEGKIFQGKTARDPRGDLWEVWQEKERRIAV
jgi:hypothetical protein